MNDSQTFGVQLIARRQNKEDQIVTIFLRITVNSQRSEISTKLSCPVNLWDGKRECVKTSPTIPTSRINNMLEQLKGKIIAIYQDLVIREELISLAAIKNRFLGIKEQGHTLQKLIDYHYQSQEHTLNAATLKHYKSTHRYLNLFLNEQKKSNDIYLKQIDYGFLTDFEAFLRAYQPTESGQRPLQHNTIMRHMSRFRTLMNLAIKLGWLSQYPFKAYKISYKQSKRGYLTQEKLEKI